MDLWSLMVIPRAELGRGTGVQVRVGGGVEALARAMAEEMAEIIARNNRAGRPTCLIVPVGPVDQYEPLARIIAEEKPDGARVAFINMDEFLDDNGAWIDPAYPLSFRESQLARRDGGLPLLTERAETQARFRGFQCGVACAEGFGPAPLWGRRRPEPIFP